MQDKQLKMKEYRHQQVPKLREFVKNERVRVKNCRGTDIKYVPGTIVHRVGPTQYLVRVDRSIRYVHVDHILKSGEAPEDMLSPDSPEAVVRDTPAVPPHVPPGIPHVPQSAGSRVRCRHRRDRCATSESLDLVFRAPFQHL